MDFLSELSRNNGVVDIDKVVEAVREEFQSNKDENHIENIVKEITINLLVQITEGAARGFDAIQKKLMGYYSIGYIAGYSVGFMTSSEIEDKEIQTQTLMRIFENIFAGHASNLFEKTFDPKNIDDQIFRDGTECGWNDAKPSISQGKEPTGLKIFLLENW